MTARGTWPSSSRMRLVSPLNVIIFIIGWTVFFLLAAKYFLYNAHQSWFKNEEKTLLAGVEFKIDNLDARNMRQLNQLYSEIKKLEVMLMEVRSDFHGQNLSTHKEAKLGPKDAIVEAPIAVLVIACDRKDYVEQTLNELLKHRPSAGLFPIIVSQDCGHHITSQAIDKFGSRVTHIKHPDLSDVVIPSSKRIIKNIKSEVGYYKISRHYKWALTQIFEEMDFQYAIIVEDDLIISPDFYAYFTALRPILDSDPTVMCASAWNDNGKEDNINLNQNDLLYRTDFFPGLGWMLTKTLWMELKPKWPSKYWDDWMRDPEQRKDRVCIRPEVSRTKTIGKVGVSKGQYFQQHLVHMVLNNYPVDFIQKNLTYLYKDAYDRVFVNHVNQLPLVSLQDIMSNELLNGEVKVQYFNNKDFETMAKKLKIMSDLRGGVPRTAYKGIVTVMYHQKRIYLVPSTPWHGYIK